MMILEGVACGRGKLAELDAGVCNFSWCCVWIGQN